MNWFLAKIVFRIICGDGDHKPQFDEQLRLIKAKSQEEAFEKAKSFGEKEQDSFMNVENKLVQWQFINVSELYRISELIDGAEMYSRIEEKEDGDSYTKIIHKKAEHIQTSDTHQLLQLV